MTDKSAWRHPCLQDVVGWDVRSWGRAIHFWEQRAGLVPPLDCLEVGARTGGLSIWLAAKGNRVTCSDLKNTEERARPLIEKYGLLGRVAFRDADATSLPYVGQFDVIAFKSVLGGIGAGDRIDLQRKAMRSVYEALRPRGKLLFAENLTGSFWHDYLRRRFLRWGNSWRYITIEEMQSFLGSFSNVEYETSGVLAAFGRSERMRRGLALVDEAICNRMVPSRSRYIVFGIATK